MKTQNKTRITFCKLDIFVDKKMSKIEKVLEMLFGTLEFTTTLWILKVDGFLNARGGARRATWKKPIKVQLGLALGLALESLHCPIWQVNTKMSNTT
jgi:hypothetical protein